MLDQPTPTSATAPPAVDRFQRVMDVFLLAVDHDPDRREQIVRAECGGDTALAGEVRAMLAAEPAKDAASGGSAHASRSGQMLTGAGLRFGADAAHAELKELEAEAAAALRSLPTIGGHYRILRTLGEGGMGVVYLAEQSVPRRMVALKAIRAGLASRSVLTRFVREANILGRLQHPGIAQIYECGVLDADESGRAFIVLEYVDGLPITRHATESKLSERERILLLADVCDAVHHAHLRGIIHRDLKPANILVERGAPGQTPRPKVLDFGIARTIVAPTDAGGDRGASPTLDGAIVGTPGYMSPEQLDGDANAVDATSDVYALGVILYQVLADRPPIDVAGRSIAEAARIVRTSVPRPIETLSRARRADVQTIIAQAMHVNRARRYQSAAALADDLRAAADGRPIAARRDSAMYVLGRVAARHRTIVVLGALLLIAGIAFAVSASVMAQRNARLAQEADAARQTADSQRSRVQSLNARLEDQLSLSRIERGRAEAAAGRLRLAEDALWSEAINNPDAEGPKWALAELYQRVPLRWARRVATNAVSMSVIPTAAGPRIAIGRSTGTIHIHDRSGTQLHVIKGMGASVAAMAPLAGERILVGLGDGRAAIINVASGSTPVFITPGSTTDRRPVLHAGGVREVAASADGDVFTLAGADRRVSVWRVSGPDGAIRRIADLPPYADSFSTHALSPDGTIVVAHGLDKPYSPTGPYATLHAYRITADGCERIWSLPRDGESFAVRMGFIIGSPESDATKHGTPRLLVGRRDFSLSTIDAATGGENVMPLRLSAASYVFTDPHGSGRALLSSSDNIALFDFATQRITPIGQQERAIVAAGWIDRDTWITLNDLSILRAGVARLDPDTTKLTDFKSWCFATSWSPTGHALAITSAEGLVAVHDGATLERQATIPLPTGIRTRGLAWLADDDTLVLGSQDGRIRIASATSGKISREFRATSSEIYGMAVDHTQRFVAVGQWNPAISVHDLASGALVANLPKPERRVEGIAFSPDNRLMITGGYASRAQVWDTSTWSEAESLALTGTAWAVAFTPDGRTLLVSNYNGGVDVFDVNLDRPAGSRFIRRETIQAHQRLVTALTVSPGGELFATGSEDGIVKLWHTKTLRNLLSTDLQASAVVQVSFSPDGRKLATANASRTCAVQDIQGMFAPVDAQRQLFEARLRPQPAKP